MLRHFKPIRNILVDVDYGMAWITFLTLFHSFSSGAFISEASVVLKACFSFRDENFLSFRREGWPWAITVFIVVD